jgi:superfamily II DNA or RNA helicase
MGTGKTTIGVAVAAGLKAARTVILCPPHLVEKWGREARAVWPEVVTMTLETPGDVDAFFDGLRQTAPVTSASSAPAGRSSAS